jgi:hypothetical protein
MARHVVVRYGKHSLDWTQFVLLAQMIGDEEVPEVAQCLMSGVISQPFSSSLG